MYGAFASAKMEKGSKAFLGGGSGGCGGAASVFKDVSIIKKKEAKGKLNPCMKEDETKGKKDSQKTTKLVLKLC